MKSGANYADRNRIKRMVLGEERDAAGNSYTIPQMAALMRIKQDVVQNWVDYYEEEILHEKGHYIEPEDEFVPVDRAGRPLEDDEEDD